MHICQFLRLQSINCYRLLGILLLLCAAPAAANPILDIPAVRIQSKSHILIDTLTGETLAEYQPDVTMPPASLTKIMTLYLAAKKLASGDISLDDLVKVSIKAWQTGGSRMFIEAGKYVSVGELIEGIAVVSGNDASIALAEHIAGSEEDFVALMNEQAQQLEMTNSHFINVSGLPDANHYTSARDIATLSKNLITKYPDFYERYFSVRTFSYNDISQVNRNRLLWAAKLRVDGIKTGHTEEAGYSLAASASQNDMRLIAVILGASSEEVRTREGEKLLRWGFRYFKHHRLYEPLVMLTTSKVWMGAAESVDLGVIDPINMIVSKARTYQISVRVQIPEYLIAPIRTGEQLGELVVYAGKKEHSRYPLIALEQIDEGGMFSKTIDWIHMHFLQLFS